MLGVRFSQKSWRGSALSLGWAESGESAGGAKAIGQWGWGAVEEGVFQKLSREFVGRGVVCQISLVQSPSGVQFTSLEGALGSQEVWAGPFGLFDCASTFWCTSPTCGHTNKYKNVLGFGFVTTWDFSIQAQPLATASPKAGGCDVGQYRITQSCLVVEKQWKTCVFFLNF